MDDTDGAKFATLRRAADRGRDRDCVQNAPDYNAAAVCVCVVYEKTGACVCMGELWGLLFGS